MMYRERNQLFTAFLLIILGVIGRIYFRSFLPAMPHFYITINGITQPIFIADMFFLVAIIALERGNNFRNHAIAIALLALSSLATEFGAALTIVLSLIVVIKNILKLLERRSWRGLVLTASYTALALVSYLLILWYMKRPALAPNPVTGVAPPVVGSFLGHQSEVFAYVIVTYGSLIPLLLIGLDSYRRLRYCVHLVVIMFILVITPWLMPYTNATLGQWDRLLMTATVFALPIALSQLRVLRRNALIAIYILVLILPGFYATMSPGLYRYCLLYTSPSPRD